MRTASWESAAGALAAFLNTNPVQSYRADLYTITLNGGQVLRWTNADVDVPAPSNLALYSEQLDNAIWQVPSSAFVLANRATAPDGAYTADKLTEAVSLSTHYLYQSVGNFSVGQYVHCGWFVKAAERTEFMLRFLQGGAFASTKYIVFDAATGTVTANVGIGPVEVLTLAGGWFRVRLGAAATGNGVALCAAMLMVAGNNTYMGDGVSGAYVWGLHVGAGNGPYLPTTATPIPASTFTRGPVITRSNTKLAVGVAVDSLDVTLAADASVTVNGVPLLPFIAAGGFDGARLLLERAYAAAPPVWGSSATPWLGALALFQGRVGVPGVNRYQAQLQINSDAELLGTMVPRNVYQPACSNTLFDSACGINKAATANGITATGATDSTRTQFASTASSAVDWALGFVVGVAGANAGISRALRTSSAGVLRTIQPWPKAVAPGDTFTVYPGCDKTMGTCNTKYANLLRFRGQPFVPAPETIT